MDLSTSRVMGIINATNDSFYSGSRAGDDRELLTLAEKHLTAGATFLDLGAASSRPGAKSIPEEEEVSKIKTGLDRLLQEFPEALISVDTYRASVVRTAADHGAVMINDISAGQLDPKMFETVASLGIPYILMHMQGQPDTMQKKPVYSNVVEEVIRFLTEKINELQNLGLKEIVIDPGFGFGKTLEHNYELLHHLDRLHPLKSPVLVGVSRKSMINKVLQTTPAEALNGTTVLHTIALQKGAQLLRVHDVKEAMEAVKIVNFDRNLNS